VRRGVWTKKKDGLLYRAGVKVVFLADSQLTKCGERVGSSPGLDKCTVLEKTSTWGGEKAKMRRTDALRK